MEEINEKLQEFNNYIVNKKVAIIGMGVSNIPLLDYFYKKNAEVIAIGTPEQIVKNEKSYTGKFLKKYLEK